MASPSPKDPKLTSSHPRIVDRAVLAALQKPMITNLSVVENAALPSKVTSHITCKQKQDISNRINGLSDAGMDAALEIIREHMPTLKGVQEDALEVDVDELSDDVLRKLLLFIQTHALGPNDPPALPKPSNYQQGLYLAAGILKLLEIDSEEVFISAVHHSESIRLIYMANRDAAVAAKQMAKKCQKVCERVFDHQFKVANLLDQRQKNYSIHCQHVNALRDQIDAADPIDRGSERLFAVRLRLEFEVKMIPTMMASVMQTFRKLGVWDRRAERRRNEWRELLGEMNERYDECEKLLQEGGKIQAGLDGMEKRLGLVAGPGMNVKRGYSLDGKRYTYRHKEVVESAGVGAGDGSGVEGDRANGLDVLS